jgi:hypothetical protein
MSIITIPTSSIGASTALDNLASVALNSSLIPASDSSIDLGSSTPKYWANAYIDKVNTPAVAFPAVQIADAGANVLDDYEEGIWYPTYTGTTGSIGSTAYAAQYGGYTKIGRMVFITGIMYLSNKGSWTGNVKLTGLPFVSSTNLGTYSSANLNIDNVTFAGNYISMLLVENVSYLNPRINTTAIGNVPVPCTGIANDTAFSFSCIYYTN